jgi:hypothetical protein
MDQELYDACENKEISGKSWAQLSKEYDFGDPEKLRGQFRREKNRRINGVKTPTLINVPDVGEISSYTEAENYIHVVCDVERIMEQDDIIKQFNIDLEKWKIKSFTIKTSEGYRKDRKVQWNVEDGKVISGHVDDSGKMLIVPMYHVSLELTRKTIEEETMTFDKVMSFFENYQSKTKSVSKFNARGYDKNGMVLEINMADFHIGNIGVGMNNESSIFEKVDYIVSDILSRIKNVKISKIILVQNGDILNFDTKGRTTTSMTHTVTTDGSTNYEIFDIGANVLIGVIDKLEIFAPVEVIGIYGNHDKISSYMLMKAIEFYYRENKNVLVDAGHGSRKFRKFGNNLVFWQHGEMSAKNIKSIIQREARREFGETKFAEIHLGNYHHQQTLEADGVIIRYLPSIAPTDEWHYDEGYTGAIQSVVSFLWDLNTGLREMWFSNI